MVHERALSRRRRTIASRYLDAVSCGGQDVSALVKAAAANSPTPVTPERLQAKQIIRNVLNDSSCGGMTATTAALDTSASWTTMETPSRSDAASRRSGAGFHQNNSNGSNGALFPAPDSAFGARPDGPLGIEGDCSSIESSSSHRRSSRPAHLAVEMDDSDLETSFEHDDYFFRRPISPAPPVDDSPPPSRLMKRAREQLAGRRHENNDTTPGNSHSNDNNNTGNNLLSFSGSFPEPKRRPPPLGFRHEDQKVVVPGSPYEMHRVGPLGWSAERSHQVPNAGVDVAEAEEQADSEAGAPTEIMTNRTRREEEPAHSEAGAPTEIMTNRTRDILKRHYFRSCVPQVEPEPDQHSRNATPTTRKWGMAPSNNAGSSRLPINMQCLIDEASTADEGSLQDDRAQMRALFDVQSSSISATSQSEASTSDEHAPHIDSWQQKLRRSDPSSSPASSRIVHAEPFSPRAGTGTKDIANNKVLYGGRLVAYGPRAVRRVSPPIIITGSNKEVKDPAKQGETDQAPTSPLRFYMQDDFTPQPKVVHEVSSSENPSSVSTTDGLLFPDMADGTKAAATFVRYNERRTPNAHEVFQRRYSDSSNASTLSTAEKEHDDGPTVDPQRPIQPLFHLDRLDFSYDSHSPLRRFHTQSQDHERGPTAQHVQPFDEQGMRRDNIHSTSEDVHGRNMGQKEEQNQRVGNSQAYRFALKMDSDQSIQPDPIFCPGGSVSFSSRSDNSTGNYNQGTGQQPYTVKSMQDRGTKEHSSTGSEDGLVQIVERNRGGTHHSTQSNAVQVAHYGVDRGLAAYSTTPSGQRKDVARATSSGIEAGNTGSSNRIPNGAKSVKNKIQAFNLKPPDKWTNDTKHQPKKDVVVGGVYEEKKEDSSVADTSVRSVRNLKEIFEKHEFEYQKHKVTHDVWDDESGSVKSLRDKIEQRISAMEGKAYCDDDDDGSVRSLRERFESSSPRKRNSGEMVNHLRSRFESQGFPKFRPAGIARPSLRHVDASAVDVQVASIPREEDSFAEERWLESHVNDSSVRHIDTAMKQMAPLTEGHRAEMHVDESMFFNANTVAERETPDWVAPGPGDGAPRVIKPDINETINRYLQNTNSDLTEKAKGGSLDPSEDEDTISTHSGQVQGPAPTPFSSMKGRLLKFSKVQVESTAHVQQRKSPPPTMQQRLNHWAKRYPAFKREPLASQDERIPESSKTESAKLTRSGSYDLSSVSKEESEREDVEAKPAVALGIYNQTNTFTKGNHSSEEARLSSHPDRVNAQDQNSSRPEMKHDALTQQVQRRPTAHAHHSHIKRNDLRGKSSDSDYSDGVTLDASITDVSILTDPTICRDTDHLYSAGISAAKNHEASRTKIPDLETLLSDEMSGETTGESSSLDATLRALESETVLTENAILPASNDQVGAEEDDGGWDMEQTSMSFSFQTSSSKGFSQSVSRDGASFQEMVWPRLDDRDWIDFSSSPTNIVSDSNAFHSVKLEGEISSLASKKNGQPQNLEKKQDVTLQGPVVAADPRNDVHFTVNSYNRPSSKIVEDFYRTGTTHEDSSLRYSEGTELFSTPPPFDKDHETLMAARHEMLLSRQRAYQERKAAREKDNASKRPDPPAEPPGLRMSNFEPSSVTPLFDSAERTPDTTGPRRGFFGRTNPPSDPLKSGNGLASANPRSSQEGYRNKASSAPGSSSKPQSTVHFRNEARTAARKTTSPPRKTSITAGQKSTSFLSRITGSLGRSNHSSKHETLVARLKSVKASRLLRMKRMPAHQALPDDKSDGSLPYEINSHVTPSPSRPLLVDRIEMSSYQAAQLPYHRSSLSQAPNRNVKSYRVSFAKNDDPPSDQESSSSHIFEDLLGLD